MAMVKASLTLFGGDTLVVRCSERCHIHLMSAKVPGDSHADILSVQDRDSAYLTVPYSGTERAYRQSQPVTGALHQLRASLTVTDRTPARPCRAFFFPRAQAGPASGSRQQRADAGRRSSRLASCIPSLLNACSSENRY